MRRPLAAVALIVAAGTAPAGTACDLVSGGNATVATVLDGDTLTLADGRTVRLAGIEAPKSLLARPGADVAGLVEASREALARLAAGAAVELRVGSEPEDRHGRLLAELRLAGGKSLQEAMVEGGWARVRPFPGGHPCLGNLFLLETEARRHKIGLWRAAEFAVIRANDPSLIERKGLYVLVEGRVVSVGRGNRLDFLNFGQNWRRDFTVMVNAPASSGAAEGRASIEAFSGRRVLVRGMLEESGGPAIRLNDPSEIEILDE